ncbi:hypothetical protein OSTOST_08979 [Ostertagia ostertagi]
MDFSNNTTSAASGRLVTGLFPDRASAESAFNAAGERGYTKDDVNLVMSDEARAQHFGSGETELGNKAAEGAGVGGRPQEGRHRQGQGPHEHVDVAGVAGHGRAVPAHGVRPHRGAVRQPARARGGGLAGRRLRPCRRAAGLAERGARAAAGGGAGGAGGGARHARGVPAGGAGAGVREGRAQARAPEPGQRPEAHVLAGQPRRAAQGHLEDGSARGHRLGRGAQPAAGCDATGLVHRAARAAAGRAGVAGHGQDARVDGRRVRRRGLPRSAVDPSPLHEKDAHEPA